MIIGGDPFAVETYFAIDAFQRWSPHVLQCEPLTTTTLAQLMLQQIEDRGYMLSKNELLVEDPNDLEQMIKIVGLKFAGSEIRQRNAYLAKDTVEHAISRKHAREDQGVGQSLQSLPSQFLLCAADFGVQIVVRKSDAAVQIDKIQAVEAEIEALVGMENGKEWFRRFKAKADYVIKTNDRTALRTCLVRLFALVGLGRTMLDHWCPTPRGPRCDPPRPTPDLFLLRATAAAHRVSPIRAVGLAPITESCPHWQPGNRQDHVRPAGRPCALRL